MESFAFSFMAPPYIDRILANSDKWPSQTSDKSLEPPERTLFDAVFDPRSADLSMQQADILKDLQMLRYGRLRQGDLLGYIAANTCILAHQEANDLDAHGVPQRFGHRGDFFIGSRTLDGAEVLP
jgi:hypothetical protein